MCFYDFLWLRIIIVALVLQLNWCYSNSWVSNIGDLVLVLIFWFRIFKRGGFCILVIIAINFLKIENGCTVVEKYAATVAYVGTYIFPNTWKTQYLKNSRSHSNACNVLISSNKKRTYWMGKGLIFIRKICLLSLMPIRVTGNEVRIINREGS